MPGLISLDAHQYYANPRNAFWWIMSEIIGFPAEDPYPQKVAHLVQAGIAVWDVLHDCVRPGSLDASIVRQSEQVNDLQAFIDRHPALQLIAFNGRTAEQIFMRHYPQLLGANSAIRHVLLPSSSPAHARLDKGEKLKIWRQSLSIGND